MINAIVRFVRGTAQRRGLRRHRLEPSSSSPPAAARSVALEQPLRLGPKAFQASQVPPRIFVLVVAHLTVVQLAVVHLIHIASAATAIGGGAGRVGGHHHLSGGGTSPLAVVASPVAAAAILVAIVSLVLLGVGQGVVLTTPVAAYVAALELRLRLFSPREEDVHDDGVSRLRKKWMAAGRRNGGRGRGEGVATAENAGIYATTTTAPILFASRQAESE
mmetsp:Transcript_35191/g.75100  ORF Transcript_35191/g.75100 Transcript_35191/m.75100 type:complete len:219 (+) Transcript_35191:2577-3233(+)